MRYNYTSDETGQASLTLFGDGLDATLVAGTHPNFKKLYDYLLVTAPADHNPDYVRTLIDVGFTVGEKMQRLSERVTYDGSSLRFDGDPLDTTLSRHIVRMLNEDDPNYVGFVRFLENLALNPSKKSKRHLFTWLHGRDFTITDTGCFIGYKGVRADKFNSSIHEGRATVNGVLHRGRIPNPLGATIEMPRTEVNADRDEGCSTGLHVGTYNFARKFGNGRTVTVAVNPRDVVAVPFEKKYQKLRTCRYRIMDVVDAPIETTTHAEGALLDDPGDKFR